MKRICFDKRFVNFEKQDLVRGKIHTIRQSFSYWKRFEGQEVALFTWEGKPYRSKQKVFCVKRIVSVQEVEKITDGIPDSFVMLINDSKAALDFEKDGFIKQSDFYDWFHRYPDGKMAILHFTDFRY
jgi:hypothetical protein